MITLWGPSSSGKTALLSYLYLRSQAVETDWKIFPTKASLEEIDRQSSRIQRDNEFPIPTIENLEREISYLFKNSTTGETFVLETKDRAGARSVAMDAEILESLNASQGIVLFLDHGQPHREIDVVKALRWMYVHRGTEGEQDMRPLAVCLSKVDLLVNTPQDFMRLEDKPDHFVRDHLSKELLGWIDQFHAVVKFFPVSSVGLRLSFGSIQKSVFLDEKLVLRVTPRGNPINVIEPFSWIFEELREAK
jgi:hypothetical protein